MKTIMNKKRVVLPFMLCLLIVMTFAMPLTAFAAASDYDVTVEHRYLKGESVDIPKTLTRYGNDYVLKTKSAPVLESTLPATRTYTYRVDDQISAEDYDKLADSTAKITPKYVTLTKQAEDQIIKVEVPTNDIERLRNTVYPEAAAAVSKGFALAEATFLKTNDKGEVIDGAGEDRLAPGRNGLPGGYKATLVYRGAEQYQQLAYYEVKETYSSSDVTGVDQYIVKAVYGLVNPPDESAENSANGNSGTVNAPAAPTDSSSGNGTVTSNTGNTGVQEGNDTDTQVDKEISDNKTPLDNGTDNSDSTQRSNPNVPTDSGTAGMSTGTLMMIIAAAIIVIAGIILLIVFTKKRNAANTES